MNKNNAVIYYQVLVVIFFIKHSSSYFNFLTRFQYSEKKKLFLSVFASLIISGEATIPEAPYTTIAVTSLLINF